MITEIPQALQPGAIVQVAGAGPAAEKGKGKKGGGKKDADKTAGKPGG